MCGAKAHSQVGGSHFLEGGSSLIFLHLFGEEWAFLVKSTFTHALLIFLFIGRYVYLRTQLILGDDLYRAYGAVIFAH